MTCILQKQNIKVMKQIYFFLIFGVIGFNGFSQSLPTQNNILGVEEHLMKEDFFFNTKNSIYPIEVDEHHISTVFGKTREYYTKFFFNSDLKVNKIWRETIGEKTIKESRFTYQNNKLVKYENFENGSPASYFPETLYLYNEQGHLKEKKVTVRFLTERSDYYTYNASDNSMTIKKYSGKTLVLQFNDKNLIASETIKEVGQKTMKMEYTYGPENLTPHKGKVMQRKDFPDSNQVNNFQLNTYDYTSNGQICMILTSGGASYYYGYVYDKYDNWIAKYNAADVEFGNDLLKNITIRQIVYSNGEITGYLSVNGSDLIDKLPKPKTDVPQEGVYWKKSGDSFWFYNNGTAITDHKWLYRNKNANVAYSPANQSFYEIYNYDTSTENQYHKGKKLDYKTSALGFGYKIDGDKFVLLYPDGVEYDYNNIKVANNDDFGNFIVHFNDGSSIVFEKATETDKFIIKPIVAFDASKHGKSSSATSTSYTWSKNAANTEFYIYINGEEIKTEHTNFFIGETLYAIDGNRKELYSIGNFYANAADTQYTVDQVNSYKTVDGLWYKTPEGNYYTFDYNGHNITDISDQFWSGNSLRFKRQSSSATFEMNNYKTANVNTIYPIKIVEGGRSN